MLFLIKQTHTPEICPKEKGGSRALYNPEAEGAVLKAMYGAFAAHHSGSYGCHMCIHDFW